MAAGPRGFSVWRLSVGVFAVGFGALLTLYAAGNGGALAGAFALVVFSVVLVGIINGMRRRERIQAHAAPARHGSLPDSCPHCGHEWLRIQTDPDTGRWYAECCACERTIARQAHQ